MATADSKIKSITWIAKRILTKETPATVVWLPNKVIKRWPAIMLAARRTARVPGRITFLIVSIKTIKGMSATGVL